MMTSFPASISMQHRRVIDNGDGFEVVPFTIALLVLEFATGRGDKQR